MGTNRLALACELASVRSLPPPGDADWRIWLRAAERAYCAGLQRADEHLVARLIAKGAAARVLDWPGEVPWDQVELRRLPPGPPQLLLHGDFQAWQRARHLPVPGVSLTHAAGHAAAVAWLPDGGRPAV